MNGTSSAQASNPCDPVVQGARQAELEALYHRDGRHDPEHPFHGLYTGLVLHAND